MVSPSAGAATYAPIFGEIDEVERSNARASAAEGAALAREAGFDATPLVARSGNVWRAILNLAAEHDASAIVVGSRGQGGYLTCCWAASRGESSTTPIGPYWSSARTAPVDHPALGFAGGRRLTLILRRSKE